MSKDARFWRNVILIALAHIALLAGFIRWSLHSKRSSNAQSIVWIGGAENGRGETKSAAPSLVKVSPKPSPKVKPTPAKSGEKAEQSDINTEKKKIAINATGKDGSSPQASSGKANSAGKAGHAGGGSSASEFGWYGNMLHDRFYSAWIQPTTNITSGSKISTLVKVRIEKDGRVANFEII